MTFCRSDQFKSFHTFVQAFEFIRSTKARQTSNQKHDLLQKSKKMLAIFFGGFLDPVNRVSGK